MTEELVSVVIPYMDEPSLLTECLQSLEVQTHRNIEVVVVDNGSIEPPVASNWFTRALTIITNPKNVGFAGAVNQGIAAGRGGHVLVLNADATLSPDYVERCLVALNDPEVAAVSGKLLKSYDSSIIDSTGHTLFGDRRVKDRGEFERDQGTPDSSEVFSVPATAAMYRRSALDDVTSDDAVFDESFFSYGEDVDLAWRLRLRGWKIWYVSEAVGHHRRAISQGRRPTERLVWDLRNRWLRMVKNDAWASIFKHMTEIIRTEIRLIGYFLVHRPLVLPLAWAGFLARLPGALRHRAHIQRNRTVGWQDLEPWFERYPY